MSLMNHEVRKPSTRSEWVAYWISNIGSPPMMVLAALVVVASLLSEAAVWRWVGLYVVLALLFPLGYLFYLLQHGQITDLDVQRRDQRPRTMIATLLGLALAWLSFLLGGAPLPFRILASASLVQGLLILLITLRWKISVHTSTAAGMIVLILSVAGLAAAPVVMTVPLIAWSRVKLHRHTFMQTLAGTGLGLGVFLTAVLLATKG